MAYRIANHSRRGLLAWASLSGGLALTLAGLQALAADPLPAVRVAPKPEKAAVSTDKAPDKSTDKASEKMAPDKIVAASAPAPAAKAKTASRQVLEIQSGRSRVGRAKRAVLDAKLLDPRIADIKLLSGADFKLTGGMPGRTTLMMTLGDAEHRETISYDVVVALAPEPIAEPETPVEQPEQIHTVSHREPSAARTARNKTYSVRGPHGFTH